MTVKGYQISAIGDQEAREEGQVGAKWEVKEVKEMKEVEEKAKKKTMITQRRRERGGAQREEKPKSTVRSDCATEKRNPKTQAHTPCLGQPADI
jgi:hypothetical protein